MVHGYFARALGALRATPGGNVENLAAPIILHALVQRIEWLTCGVRWPISCHGKH